jgi:hypothetical protein
LIQDCAGVPPSAASQLLPIALTKSRAKADDKAAPAFYGRFVPSEPTPFGKPVPNGPQGDSENAALRASSMESTKGLLPRPGSQLLQTLDLGRTRKRNRTHAG